MSKIILCIFTVVTLLALNGCAAFQEGRAKKVVLKHPQTLDFVDCTVSRLESNKSYEENDACVKAYQEKGYVIWDSY